MSMRQQSSSINPSKPNHPSRFLQSTNMTLNVISLMEGKAIFNTRKLSFIVSCAPLLCKSQDGISIKGEGCNTPCYDFPNSLYYGLNQESSTLINLILCKSKSKFK
jgi:hypothetical protein